MGSGSLVPFAKAVVDSRFRRAARHRILGAGSFKSASVVAGASSSSSPRRGAVHRLGAFRGGPAFVGIDIVRSPVRIGAKQKYMELGRPKTKVITPEFLGQNYLRYTKLYHEIFNIQ